ncbi:hypothetical protein Aperf_G00000130666 [Anoplocephala perfoliata]
MAVPSHSLLGGLPVKPHILLPDRWLYTPDRQAACTDEEITLELLDNHYFSAALHFAIDHSTLPFIDFMRRPRAVSWFNLEVNPLLKDDVVAVILPIVGWKRADILHLQLVVSSGDGESHCYVETHHCMRNWRLNELLNLRIVVALPWPDLIPRCGKWIPNVGEERFMDLSILSKRGIQVTVLPNVFEDTTRELLITTLILMLKGFGRERSEPTMNIFEKQSLASLSKSPKVSPAKWKAKPPSRAALKLFNCQPSASLTPSQYPVISSTAPPTSLTLATDRNDLLFRPGIADHYGTHLMAQKSWREITVGFLGILTDSAKKAAKLLREGFEMTVIYHQKHRLSDLGEIHFVSKMSEFLSSCDVVILMDDFSDRRIFLSKAFRSRTPISQKSTKRTRFSLQEDDFRYFKPSALFISTSAVENFSFAALATALRNQAISGAAFTIPLDGNLSSDELQSLQHMKNVLALPPPSTAGFGPKHLRRRLAGMVFKAISDGLGLPFFGPQDLEFSSSQESSGTDWWYMELSNGVQKDHPPVIIRVPQYAFPLIQREYFLISPFKRDR